MTTGPEELVERLASLGRDLPMWATEIAAGVASAHVWDEVELGVTETITQAADTIASLIRERDEQSAIVARIWDLLGRPSYEELAGRSIYDLVAEGIEARSSAEAERDALRGVVEAKDAALKPFVKAWSEASVLVDRKRAVIGDILAIARRRLDSADFKNAARSLSAGVGSPSESKGSVAGEAGASSALPPTDGQQVCDLENGSVSRG